MVFMWAKYLQRNTRSFSGAGGRCGASCLRAGGHSLFSTRTAHRWEWKKKKPPRSATTAYMNGKGLFATFQVVHSLSTPGYLRSNLEVLRRQRRPKLFPSSVITKRGGAMLRAPARRCRRAASAVLTAASLPPGISCGISGGNCSAIWTGAGERQSSGQKWHGKQLGPMQGRWLQRPCCSWPPSLPRGSCGAGSTEDAAAPC